MEKEEILEWSGRHDEDYGPWIEQEEEIGKSLRSTRELNISDLASMCRTSCFGISLTVEGCKICAKTNQHTGDSSWGRRSLFCSNTI